MQKAFSSEGADVCNIVKDKAFQRQLVPISKKEKGKTKIAIFSPVADIVLLSRLLSHVSLNTCDREKSHA